MVAKVARRGRNVVVAVVALLVVGAIACNGWLQRHPEAWLEVQLLFHSPADSDAGRVDPELAKRIAAAQKEAKKAGLALVVVTGYRPWNTQLTWYRQGLASHGSQADARKHVLPPWESMHVRGLAVDVKEGPAAKWLVQSNGRYGLCQRYANEPWHFEMFGAPGEACPAMEQDASKGNPQGGH